MFRDFSCLLGFCRVCPENFPAKVLKILPILVLEPSPVITLSRRYYLVYTGFRGGTALRNEDSLLDFTFQQGYRCTWVCIHGPCGQPCMCIVGPYIFHSVFHWEPVQLLKSVLRVPS